MQVPKGRDQVSGGVSKREVPRGVRNSKVRRQDKFRRDWSRHQNTCKSQSGTGPGVRRSKRPLLACRTRCICSIETLHNQVKVKFGNKVQISNGQKLVQCPINGGCHCMWTSSRMSCNIRERGTSYCLVRSPFRPQNFLRDDFKRSLTYPCPRSLLESRIAFRIKHS